MITGFLTWMAENPILTVVLAIIISETIVRVKKYNAKSNGGKNG